MQPLEERVKLLLESRLLQKRIPELEKLLGRGSHQCGVVVASSGLASSGGHRDQLAIGRQIQHRVRVGDAHQRELLRRQPQIMGEQQRRQGGASSFGRSWSGCRWSERHISPGSSINQPKWAC